MHRSHLSVFVTIFALSSSCTDGPFSGPLDPNGIPAFLISDALHGGGNEHFFWLPPMVEDPASFNADFDGSLAPTVTICELSDCGMVIGEYTTMTGPGSETVRIDVESEHYIVNWHTDETAAQPGTTYRVTVTVDATELGFADVQLGVTGKDAKNLSTNEIIGLKDGRTLPVKFRIEEGALDVAQRCNDAPQNVWAARWEGPDQGLHAFDQNGTGVGVGLFSGADVVDIGPDCLLYVASYSQNKIWRYQTDLTFVDEFASVNMSHATFMAFDADGNLYVSNYTSNSISKYLADGTPAGIFASVGTPRDIAFDAAGRLYVARRHAGVDRYLADGTYDGVFASTNLSQPVGLAFDPDGNLYVSNETSNVIQKFSTAGVYLGPFASAVNPHWDSAIKIDADGVLWVINNAGIIRRFSLADGSELAPAPWLGGLGGSWAGVAIWNELLDPNLR